MNKLNKDKFGFVVLLATMLLSVKLMAQIPIDTGIFTVNNIEYRVSKPDVHPRFGIMRVNRPYTPPNRTIVNNIPLDYIGTNVTNLDASNQIVRDVLGTIKLNALKQNGERLDIHFSFKPDGKIIYAYYGVEANTILTLNDIAKIDSALLMDYKATFTSVQNAHQYLYSISAFFSLNLAK